jgi:hypothetical protein
MKETDFAYWLQGFFEIAKPESVSPEQVKIIKNHIALVKKCWEPKKFDLPNPDLSDFWPVTPPGEQILKC